MAEYGTVPRPRVPVQAGQGLDDSGPQRIEMDVPGEFEEVRLLLHHNRAVAILKQVALSMVAPVEGTGIAGEQATHEGGEGPVARSEEQVEVVREQGPREDRDARRRKLSGKKAKKIRPVRVAPPPRHVWVESVDYG